ncbi:MAG: glutamate formimidoyltransferase [Actinomycetia bacterium]|nr:glutamate formimidoyltransferase [Actinomycetes bacterium]
MELVECVPNFSEGRRPEVIAAIRAAVAAVPGVAVLDVSSDASHNRTVVTFVAPRAVAVRAAFAGIAAARDLIDLTTHRGEHPRIGATDVCPFVPLEGTTMDDCVALARELGQRVGAELGIPVFLYERAATRPDRQNLANVRRGQFEQARTEIGTNPDRIPDFGPNAVHPTAGATIIGARPFLVAYNVYLGGAENLQVAKDVARAVRGSSGGLRYVKALGLEVDGQAQVSMNLVDTDQTPLSRVFDLVRTEAEARGVSPTRSELVGLVPEQVLFETAARHVRLPGVSPAMVLEHTVRATLGEGDSLRGFMADVAGSSPVPGGGSVSALAGQLAAALAQMVAGLTVGRPRYAEVETEMREIAAAAAHLGDRLGALVREDADAYAAVGAAYRLPKDPAAAPARAAAIQAALLQAAAVPLETARACRDVALLAAACAARGNPNAVSDAGVAGLLAEAACRGAAYNVRINVAAMADPSAGADLAAEAAALVAATHAAAAEAAARVDAAIG